MIQSLFNIRQLEELSSKDSVIHRIHPVVKLVVTLGYLIAVVSFDKYEISGLVPFVLYPVLIATLAEIPVWPVVKKILFIEPFIIMIGILNPLFDSHIVSIGSFNFSAGWFTCISLCLKSALTLSAVLMLLASTGIDQIGYALRVLRVPRLFVLQFLLTYRYISVLAEEVTRTMTAYTLRSSGRRGLARRVWGSLPGQILLRSIDRAERLYTAMCLRGFSGDYHHKRNVRFHLFDCIYLLSLLALIACARWWNLPQVIGSFIQGVFL